ncbi:MAG TPA: DNA-formamidopyrimidine glycosylase family protein [Egibacteraceae bacterium]|nr:DNA-formamidopyrimidine glycosylase family protein [Egibacteraceae bacterium]
MPEGDTVFRTAAKLRSALSRQAVTELSTTARQPIARGVERLITQSVAEVSSRGKHLLIWFEPSGLAIHTHLGMNGAWHVYEPTQAWKKPRRLARLTIGVPDAIAVCFSPQVCRLLAPGEVERDPSLASLGPDALDDAVDLAQARRRLDQRGDWTVGEALLDQRVLAGIGNVYKSEVLFIHSVDPWAPVSEIADTVRDALLATAVSLLKANAVPEATARTTTPAGFRQRLHVYARAGRPCPRCGGEIRAARQGERARTTYWCPTCQGAGPDRC